MSLSEDSRESYDSQALIVDNEPTEEKIIFEFYNRPATINCLCCKFSSSERTKNRFFAQLLLLILLIQVGENLAVSYFVGQLGQEVVNTQSTVDNIFNYAIFVESILVTGLTARLSQARGENIPQKMRGYILLGMISSLFYGIVASVILLGIRTTIFSVTNLTTDGTMYYILSAIALPFDFARSACLGIMLGLFELPFFTLVSFIFTGLNICGIFISTGASFGLSSIPLINLVCDFGVLVVVLGFFSRKNYIYKKFGFSLFEKGPLRISDIFLFINDNFFLIIYDSLSVLTQLALIPLSSSIGPSQQTAMTIFSSLNKFSIGISNAFGLGLTMIGGTLVAKQRYDILRQYFSVMTGLAVLFNIAFSLALIFAPSQFKDFLYASQDNRRAVFHYVDSLWWVSVAIHPIIGLCTALEGMLFAFTEFKVATIMSVVATVVGFIPLAIAGEILKNVYTLAMAFLAFVSLKLVCFLVYYFTRLLNKKLVSPYHSV